MVQAIAAVVAGFVTILLAVMGSTTIAARALLPPSPAGQQPMPTTTYIVVNLLLGFGSAFVGGLVAAKIGQGRTPVLVLGGIILVLGIASAAFTPAESRQGQPIWYLWALPAIGALGVAVGGRAL